MKFSTKLNIVAGAILCPALVAKAGVEPISEDAGYNLTLTTLPGIIEDNIMPFLFWSAGFVSVAALVIGGIMYMTSAGNEEKANKAKKMITYSIIGVFVVLLSIIAINAIQDIIKGDFSVTL